MTTIFIFLFICFFCCFLLSVDPLSRGMICYFFLKFLNAHISEKYLLAKKAAIRFLSQGAEFAQIAISGLSPSLGKRVMTE